MNSNKKRETKYDKLLRSMVFAIDVFREKGTSDAYKMVDFLQMLKGSLEAAGAIGAGSRAPSESISDYVASLQGQTEHFPSDFAHPNRVAARESLAYFFETFPDYLKRRNADRDKVIERNQIRTDAEFGENWGRTGV